MLYFRRVFRNTDISGIGNETNGLNVKSSILHRFHRFELLSLMSEKNDVEKVMENNEKKKKNKENHTKPNSRAQAMNEGERTSCLTHRMEYFEFSSLFGSLSLSPSVSLDSHLVSIKKNNF